jgi:hypothetical protein
MTNINRRNKMSKYDPLNVLLAGNSNKVVTLSMNKINDVINSKLPNSAYKHREWWGNDSSHTQAKAWLNAGWKVDSVILGTSVTFKKD